MNEFERRNESVIRVLLVSTHDWFTSALQAVLEPEGFVFARARSARHALRYAEQSVPDLVILSEKLPDLDGAGLVRSLRSGGLPDSVPLLVYSPNFWHVEDQAMAMAAGAWDIIREPLRPTIIVPKLHRLLTIGRLIRAAEEEGGEPEAAGLPKLARLTRSIRRIEATAQRNAVPLSCVVIGPSRPGNGTALDRQRSLAGTLCAENLRLSDLCGWVAGADFGIVAYNTTAAGVISMVRRLNERIAAEASEALRPLSAGVIELPTDDGDAADSPPDRDAPGGSHVASLSRLAAAHAALHEARESGGGIRIGRSA